MDSSGIIRAFSLSTKMRSAKSANDLTSIFSVLRSLLVSGTELGNAQNGTVDLGRFSLDNMESVTLYNGQK